jgi:hypothetical protein
MPIGHPEIPCEALIAEDFAVASALQDLKLDVVCEEGVKIRSLNVEASTVDHVIDKTTCSGSSRPEGRTSNLCELSWMNVSRSSLGSLCYQIPTLDDIITAYSTVFSRHHEQDHCGDGFQSPT